jgi:hypothetical protein
MPFLAANFSHLVGSLAAGIGFSRGRGVAGAGSMRCTPSEVDLTGQVDRSWLMRAWAASRAVALSASSSAPVGMGLGSFASRFPRSKVKGVGLLTVTGLGHVSKQWSRSKKRSTYSRLETVESVTEWTSMAPPLISSASCECVGDVTLNATPPPISMSDMIVVFGLWREAQKSKLRPRPKVQNNFWGSVGPCTGGGPPRQRASQNSFFRNTRIAHCRGLEHHWPAMPPSTCLRSLSVLSLDATPTVPRLLRPHTACFSTSSMRYAAVVKKKGMTAAPKKGVKSLNTKKSRKAPGGDTGKRPAQGERKAQRKRIVLSNDNALEVSSLQDLSKDNVLSEKNEGKVMGLPQENVVDALRAVEAFKTTQGWSLFRRPAVLMRKEAIQLAKLFKEVEDSASGQKKTVQRILYGERMSGKSTLLLQGLAMAFLRDWFVINLPEGTCASE